MSYAEIEDPLVRLYCQRKNVRQRVLETHVPLPNLSPAACAERAPLWLQLDDLNARIRECKGRSA